MTPSSLVPQVDKAKITYIVTSSYCYESSASALLRRKLIRLGIIYTYFSNKKRNTSGSVRLLRNQSRNRSTYSVYKLDEQFDSHDYRRPLEWWICNTWWKEGDKSWERNRKRLIYSLLIGPAVPRCSLPLVTRAEEKDDSVRLSAQINTEIEIYTHAYLLA